MLILINPCRAKIGEPRLNKTFTLLTALLILVLLLSGDIEMNPGPLASNRNTLSFCHWNLNSILTENFVRVSLIHNYMHCHNIDIAAITESHLDSTIESDDSSLHIHGYSCTGTTTQLIARREEFSFTTGTRCRLSVDLT